MQQLMKDCLQELIQFQLLDIHLISIKEIVDINHLSGFNFKLRSRLSWFRWNKLLYKK